MVRIYYLMRSLKNDCNQLKEYECRYDRWADVRGLLEKELIPEKTPHVERTRVYERQSFFGCVVHQFPTNHNVRGSFAYSSCYDEWRRRSNLLPPLENGSVLLDGDVVILARTPARATLYLQDTMHRFWLVSLLQRHFAQSRNDQRWQHVADSFHRAVAGYDLKLFVARLLALSAAALCPKQDLQHHFNKALTICSARDCAHVFDFSNAYAPSFGSKLMPLITQTLSRVCIDINRRTKFMSRLIYESGGEVESGDAFAKRLQITDHALVALVRDVVHAYQPQHCSNIAKEPTRQEEEVEEEEEEEDDDSEPLAKRQRNDALCDGLENTPAALSTEQLEVQNQYQKKREGEEEKTEDQRLQEVLDVSASGTANVIYNTQLYCVTCDVPGHHTCDCPRRDFLEQLRSFCRASWEVFYAPENGICPLANSSMALFAAKHFRSKAGIIIRRTFRYAMHRAAVPRTLPKLPLPQFELPAVAQHTDLRWIAD